MDNKYNYVVLNTKHQKIKNSGYASSKEELKAFLASSNLKLIKCRKVKNYTNLMNSKIKSIVISNFCENLVVMLKSGVSLVNALKAFNENYHHYLLNYIIKKIIRNLQAGMSFSTSLETFKQYFPSLFIMMIKTGEESNKLIDVLVYLKSYYYKEHLLKQKVKSALIYPCLLLGITILIVGVLFFFIIPKFKEIFINLNLQEMPKITVIVFNISNFFQKNAIFVLVGILICYLVIKMISRAKGNYTLDYLKTKSLIYGKIQKWLITSKFTRSLAMMYGSGIPLFTALSKTISLIDNKYLRKKLEVVNTRVYQGQNLSSALTTVGYFPVLMIEMIKIGEESNNLDNVLKSTADYYDNEADNKTAKLTKIIEPTIIVLMALIVTLVVIAVFLPLFKIMNEMVEV